ncbi:MAG: 50S ribosomal protein L29 [Acidimicrobiales bacterium]
MPAFEYSGMERSELLDKLLESRKELFNLRFQKATGQLDNTARLGHVKKDVARILTVLRNQELGAGEPGGFGWGAAATAEDEEA